MNEDEESLTSKGIKIENNICKFKGKVKQVNIKYELNNNSKFDNGVKITQKESEEDNKALQNDSLSNNSISKPVSPNVELNDDYSMKHKSGMNSPRSIEYEPPPINQELLANIEKTIGYDRKYLSACLKKNEINYATATYYLLNK